MIKQVYRLMISGVQRASPWYIESSRWDRPKLSGLSWSNRPSLLTRAFPFWVPISEVRKVGRLLVLNMKLCSSAFQQINSPDVV